MDNLMSSDERRRRHKAWLEGFGFSTKDWRRIRQLAEDTTPNASPAALQDLSVPIRVAATPAEDRRWVGGDNLGVVTNGQGLKVALLYWRMTERERRSWADRRRSHR